MIFYKYSWLCFRIELGNRSYAIADKSIFLHILSQHKMLYLFMPICLGTEETQLKGRINFIMPHKFASDTVHV